MENNLLKKIIIEHNKPVTNDPMELIYKYYVKFSFKSWFYALMYWMLSIFLTLASFVLAILATLISAKILTSPQNYALSVLIVGAITSFSTAMLTFFLFKKRYKTNYSLKQFIELERIIYDNQIGIYALCSNPKLLFLERLYEKLGIVSIIQKKQIDLPTSTESTQ